MGQHVALVWLIASMIHAPAAVADAQPPTGGSSGVSSSYLYLSRDAVRLVDQYLVSKGLPRGPEGYEKLSGTQRTTFESIVHALEFQGHLGIVDRVTEIWGGRIGARGVDQFRLSVLLIPGAVASLLAHRDYKMNVFGHVKLPSGEVIGARGADSVRQRGRRPTLQISWLEDDVTVGEVDIDYRENGEGHLRPPNSDIRGRVDGGETHYDRHVERFWHLPAWWRIP